MVFSKKYFTAIMLIVVILSFSLRYFYGALVGNIILSFSVPLAIIYYTINKLFLPYTFSLWVLMLPVFVFQLGYDILGMEKNFYWIVLIVVLMIIGTVLLQLKLIKRIESKEIQKKAFRKTLNYGCFLLFVYLATYFFMHFINYRFPPI